MDEAVSVPVSAIDRLPDGWDDLSLAPKWRTFSDPSDGCPMGHAIRDRERLIWCVSPGEWTVMGPRPQDSGVVDLTHVRAAIRIPSDVACRLLPSVCALDLDERTFPVGAAVRTEAAGLAVEMVREASGLLLVVSRSHADYFAGTLLGIVDEK